MPIFIDPNTGFPSETPCARCGWPMYCCLCGIDDNEGGVVGQIVFGGATIKIKTDAGLATDEWKFVRGHE